MPDILIYWVSHKWWIQVEMVSVLIVEDDLSLADLVEEILEQDGFSICGVARTIKEAEDAVALQVPDFAVIDIRLARGDLGTDVAANLRRTTRAGIMFSTGNSNDFALIGTLGDAVMTKPYRISDIGRGLKIIDEVARLGHTDLMFPRNFKLLVRMDGSISGD